MSSCYVYNNTSSWNMSTIAETSGMIFDYTKSTSLPITSIWTGTVVGEKAWYALASSVVVSGAALTDTVFFIGFFKDSSSKTALNNLGFHICGDTTDNSRMTAGQAFRKHCKVMEVQSSGHINVRAFNDNSTESELTGWYQDYYYNVKLCSIIKINNNTLSSQIGVNFSKTGVSGSLSYNINSGSSNSYYTPTYEISSITITNYDNNNDIYCKFYYGSNSATFTVAAGGSYTISNYRASAWSCGPNSTITMDVTNNSKRQMSYCALSGIKMSDLSTTGGGRYNINTTRSQASNPSQQGDYYVSNGNYSAESSDLVYFQGFLKTLTSEQKTTLINNNFHFIMSENDDRWSTNQVFEIQGKITKVSNGSYKFAIFNDNSTESGLTHLRCGYEDWRNIKKCSKLKFRSGGYTTTKSTISFVYNLDQGDKTYSYTSSNQNKDTIWLPTYTTCKSLTITNNNNFDIIASVYNGDTSKKYVSWFNNYYISSNSSTTTITSWTPNQLFGLSPGDDRLSVICRRATEAVSSWYQLIGGESRNPFEIITLNGTTILRYKNGSSSYAWYSTPSQGSNYNNKVWLPPFIMANDCFCYDNSQGFAMLHQANLTTTSTAWKYIKDTYKCGKPFTTWGSDFTNSYISIPCGRDGGRFTYFYNAGSSSPAKCADYNPNNGNTYLTYSGTNYYVCIPCWKLTNSCASGITVSAYGFTVPNENELNATGYRMPVGYATTVTITNNSNKIQKIYRNSNLISVLYPNKYCTYSVSNTGTTINTSDIITSSVYTEAADIKVNGSWKKAKAMIKINGSWKTCQPYVWKDGAWHKTS